MLCRRLWRNPARRAWLGLGILALVVSSVTSARAADSKRVAFIAGRASHGYGAHEHKAGCLLLAAELQKHVPGIQTVVHTGGWPEDPAALDGCDTVVVYSDGGEKHPILEHLDQVEALMNQGVGFVCLHYAVEVPQESGGKEFLNWLGGYFEIHWSVNPHWVADYSKLPDHPITRGVEPFSINDEWYYHMRFPEGMKNVTPILSAIPPASTLSRPDGHHSGNPAVRAEAGQPQHMAWAVERPDGGRGFGFTGGHFHWNWGHEDFRRLVLNAIVWTARGEIPDGGIPVSRLTLEDLEASQDFEPNGRFDRAAIQAMLDEWNRD